MQVLQEMRHFGVLGRDGECYQQAEDGHIVGHQVEYAAGELVTRQQSGQSPATQVPDCTRQLQ